MRSWERADKEPADREPVCVGTENTGAGLLERGVRLQSLEWLRFATILPEFCGRNLKIKKEECGILFLYRN